MKGPKKLMSDLAHACELRTVFRREPVRTKRPAKRVFARKVHVGLVEIRVYVGAAVSVCNMLNQI